MAAFIKETKTVVSFTWLLLAFYGLYALFGIGFNGLLFSMAVGLIAYSVLNSILIVAAITILAGVMWRTVIAPRVFDAFKNAVDMANVHADTAAFPKPIAALKIFGGEELTGVSSPFTEGFADASTLDASRPDATGEKSTTVATPSSTQATTDAPTATKVLAEATPNKEATTAAAASAIPVIGVQKDKKPEEDKRDGFHVDAASTLMTALNSLDTKTIENMTADTRSLLETQKSLMSMLGSMKPLLSDSQDMMSTFNSMFGAGAKK
jgi:hypothetical protein